MSLLQRVEAEGEANYLGKRKIGKGIGGIFGGVILGIVGWIVVGIAGAIVGLVVAIVMFICTLFGGDPHFSESIIQWCAWIGAGLGGVGGAVLGASGLGNTVGEWIKRE